MIKINIKSKRVIHTIAPALKNILSNLRFYPYLRVVPVVVAVVDENEFCWHLSDSRRNLQLGCGDRHDDALVHVVLPPAKRKQVHKQIGKKEERQIDNKAKGQRGKRAKRQKGKKAKRHKGKKEKRQRGKNAKRKKGQSGPMEPIGSGENIME